MMRRTIVAILLILAACSESSTKATPAPEASGKPVTNAGSASSTAEATTSVVDTQFEPATLSVAAGTKVTWTQTGDQPHSVTSAEEIFDSAPGCSPVKSDECNHKGDTFAYVFDKPGTFRYYCSVHGTADGTGMSGTVTVG